MTAVATLGRLGLGGAVAEVPVVAGQALAGGAADLGQRHEPGRGRRRGRHDAVLYGIPARPAPPGPTNRRRADTRQ